MFAGRLPLRTPQPLETARRLRLLPVRASNGVPVDLLFAQWPIERQAIENAMVLRIDGQPVRVATLDYLLFLKLISDRPQDLTDAEKLLRHHRGKVDLRWLEGELMQLAESTGQPEMIERFQKMQVEE
jgi:hypothetical protein